MEALFICKYDKTRQKLKVTTTKHLLIETNSNRVLVKLARWAKIFDAPKQFFFFNVETNGKRARIQFRSLRCFWLKDDKWACRFFTSLFKFAVDVKEGKPWIYYPDTYIYICFGAHLSYVHVPHSGCISQ